MAVSTDTASELLIGLSDLALLARVQRPVPTMWRNRPTRTGQPFPEPAAVVDGQELFDAYEMVEWLASTGRGNNPEAAADLAAFATVREAPLRDETVFGGVTALLCLQGIAGELPDDDDDLLDLADGADPDDEYLYQEVVALGDRLAGLARYSALLASAAFSPAGAFEKLLGDRLRLSLGGLADADLKMSVRSLVARVARALATEAEFRNVLVVDPTPGGSDVAVDVARLIAEERGSLEVATPSSPEPLARLLRRRLRVHGLPHRTLLDDGAGGYRFPGDALIVTRLPPMDDPSMSDPALLAVVDRIALNCSDRQRVVVIGRASALADRSRDPQLNRIRRDLLKSGLVRAIVRLPVGLASRQGRRRLTLWCLGPVGSGTDNWPFAGQATLTADLANSSLNAATTDALVADLVAGMAGRQGLKSHGLRLCRVVPTSALQVSDDDLVTAGTPASARQEASLSLERIRTLGERVDSDVATFHAPPIAARTTPVRPRTATIDEAIKSRHLRVLSGLRLDPVDLGTDSGLPVVTVDQLVGGGRPRPSTIDPLVLAAQYPTSKITEANDVVFCTAPRPAAWVDREGGSVVAFPARVLRCLDPGLVPAVVAADINAQLPAAKDWRGWSLRYVPADQWAALTAIVATVAAHRAELRDRLAALDQYDSALFAAVTSGALDLDPKDSTHRSKGH